MEQAVFVCMHINATNSVMLQSYLRHDFYSILFQIKHKLHIPQGQPPLPPPPQVKNSGSAPLNPGIIAYVNGYVKIMEQLGAE
jgi:hypothetical protein